MPEELLTIKEIARRLNMPESTVRYYRDKWPEYMPEVEGGRYKKYRPEAVQVIEIIASANRRNEAQQTIAESLNAQFARNMDPGAEQAQPSAAAAQQQTDISNNREYYKLIAALRDEIFYLRGQVQELQQDNRELTNQLLQLKAPDRLPWYKRIFKRGNV